jgi:phenylacetate-CoA ligase
MGLLNKAYGTVVTARNLIGQRRIPYLPEERLRELRDRRVRQIVDYAARSVPYYQDLLRSEGLEPARIRTAEDLERLPLVHKRQVRSQPERFISTSRWGRTAVPFLTSGTTGEPVDIYHDRYSLLVNSAFNQRFTQVLRHFLGRQGGFKWLTIHHPDDSLTQMQKFLSENRFMPLRRQQTAVDVSAPLDAVIAAINRERPALLSAYGSYLEALFKGVAARGINMHVPGVVYFGGDTMSDGGRRLIEEQFGAVVLSTYQAIEAFKIGFFCEERSGFHLHEDLVHVTIVDAAGRPVPAGEKGEVVISNLVNRGTVLLNYRLGDLAALSDEPCPCGRTLRLLTGLEGRVLDVIWMPDGSFVHPVEIWKVISHSLDEGGSGLLQYQLIQHELALFELRLATVDRRAFDRMGDELVNSLRRLLGQSSVIEPVYYEERLPTDDRGKLRSVTSRVEPPHLS